MCCLEAHFDVVAKPLERIPEIYSKELWHLCRNMLEKRPEDRVGLDKILKNALITGIVSEIELKITQNQVKTP